jgi:FtsZ-binding cell division protein ZapB
MQPPPTNRILQRTGVPPPLQQKPPQQQQQQQFNPRMMPPPQQAQAQGQMRGQAPMQAKGRQQPQPMMARPQSPGLPPLPPPVKTAGPLYGIPIHPLVMFKTHDNKLSEHELSIGDCFEQLKEIDERLAAVESSNGNGVGAAVAVNGDGGSGDLNDLMNDDVFINGIVDNIMNTTNFASIVENVIPLKEENEALKQQVAGLHEQVAGLHEQVAGLHEQLEEWKERMQQLEDQVRSICFGASTAAANELVISEAVASDEKCMNNGEGEDHAEEEEEEEEEE